MASRVIYLDSDDEITSAASRIRDVEAAWVAVVLPYGSRVATSRINFRLLSRDAMTHEKRLSIVSGDAATRALAASAGLPVFGSVAEYEAAIRAEEASAAGTAGIAAATGATAAAGTTAGAARTVAADGSLWSATVAQDAPGGPARGGVAGPAMTAAALAGDTVRADIPATPVLPAGTGAAVEIPGAAHGGSRTTTVAGRAGGGASRVTLLVGIAILALAGLVAAVGAYLLLPSASIAVTPQPERIGPVEMTVVADPAASTVDPARLLVPASQVDVDVSVSGTFEATGMRVEETNATGIVRFENLDFLNTNTVRAGSIVGTNSGVRFRTNGTVTVPKADIVGLSLFPGKISVKVTAVKPGTDGNVDPNTIVVVPGGEDPIALKVRNPTATSGGTHDEFPRVTQGDVDAAMATLGTQLDEAFMVKLADPSLAPAGTTLFPESGVLGEATPTVDPTTLVGQEVATFDLGLTATGTAVAVDTDAVTAVAEAQLRSQVQPGHELVPDSVQVTVGDGFVVGQTVHFPVTASAEQIAVLDPLALEAMVLGKSVSEAEAILAPYGTVEITLWPDWMGTIPTFESRVTLTIEEAVPVESPSPSPSGANP